MVMVMVGLCSCRLDVLLTIFLVIFLTLLDTDLNISLCVYSNILLCKVESRLCRFVLMAAIHPVVVVDCRVPVRRHCKTKAPPAFSNATSTFPTLGCPPSGDGFSQGQKPFGIYAVAGHHNYHRGVPRPDHPRACHPSQRPGRTTN